MACIITLVFIVLNVRDGTESKYPSIVFLSIVKPISKRYQKTAKQNSLKCIQEALPNTSTLNLKIHNNLH